MGRLLVFACIVPGASIPKIRHEWIKQFFRCGIMSNNLNEDFIYFLISLNKNDVEYILVGGYTVIFHGYNRTTGDLDLWINPTKENY